MENKLWIGLIVVLIGFVMVGESSFLEGANDGGIEYEMMENLEEAASLAAQLGGKGICCSGSNCIGGVCKKNCLDLAQECGFGKGICCSGSTCIGGVCKKNCKDLSQECGLFGKGICCSGSNCIGGVCKKNCVDLNQECGFGKGICCSGSNCIGGVCKKNCKDLGQECGIFGKGIPFAY
ncbi:unnamed protein product [Amaranthus hypochondriacus]